MGLCDTFFKKYFWGLEISSTTERLPGKLKALSSIPRSPPPKKNKMFFEMYKAVNHTIVLKEMCRSSVQIEEAAPDLTAHTPIPKKLGLGPHSSLHSSRGFFLSPVRLLWSHRNLDERTEDGGRNLATWVGHTWAALFYPLRFQ